MSDDLYKFPRLYSDTPLGPNLQLTDGQAHYVRTVLRKGDGETIRLFNGRDGEWTYTLTHSGKRDAAAINGKQVKAQAPRARRVHLLFPPIKKDRLDTLIDMAVQLDVTDLHPVLTDRTEVREIKEERFKSHLVEAAEQCERLDIPTLHPLLAMDKALVKIGVPVFAGLERSNAKPLTDTIVPSGDCACLVGPVGGWTDREREALNETPNLTPVTLGANVLRCETAVAAFLTRLALPAAR